MDFDKMKDAPAKLLKDTQVAELLGVNRSTVWDLVKANKIPKPHKLSGRITRWSGAELKKWHDDFIGKEMA